MTASDAIMAIYPDILKTCRKVLPEMADDLGQEVMLTLFEKPEAKIMAAYNGGYFLFYVVRIILNLARSKNSSLHHKFQHLDNREEVTDAMITTTHYNHDIDNLFAIAKDEMNSWAKDGVYPYEKNLFELHLLLGNKAEIVRKTGIPRRSVCYTIDNCKEKLKKRLNGTTHYHNPIVARCLRYRVYARHASVVLPTPIFQAIQLRYVLGLMADNFRHVRSSSHTSSNRGYFTFTSHS